MEGWMGGMEGSPAALFIPTNKSWLVYTRPTTTVVKPKLRTRFYRTILLRKKITQVTEKATIPGRA